MNDKWLAKWVACAAAALVLLSPRQVEGLDPAKAITQYVHEVWRTGQGLPQNTVPAITQTPDGYIWLGTELGAVREFLLQRRG